MLFCAGISGRYYTDWHHVDEDMTTIVNHGGRWDDISITGITCRNIWDSPTGLSPNVASRLIYLS